MMRMKAPEFEVADLFPIDSLVRINSPGKIVDNDTGIVTGYDGDDVFVRLDSKRTAYRIYEDTRAGIVLFSQDELTIMKKLVSKKVTHEFLVSKKVTHELGLDG